MTEPAWVCWLETYGWTCSICELQWDFFSTLGFHLNSLVGTLLCCLSSAYFHWTAQNEHFHSLYLPVEFGLNLLQHPIFVGEFVGKNSHTGLKED